MVKSAHGGHPPLVSPPACHPALKASKPLTSFECRLYKACAAIPRGKVATYGMLADLLGSCARAVGQGMRRNKFAPTVPCHRVVSANLGLGGFHGSWGDDTPDVQRKRRMLLEEGVVLDGNKIAKKSLISAEQLAQCFKVAKEVAYEIEHCPA